MLADYPHTESGFAMYCVSGCHAGSLAILLTVCCNLQKDAAESVKDGETVKAKPPVKANKQLVLMGGQ